MHQLTPILVALGFNALDLCTGFISAIKNKEIQSSKLRDGLFKKVGFMFCYFLAWIIDNYGAIAGIHLDFSILSAKSIQTFYQKNLCLCSTSAL